MTDNRNYFRSSEIRGIFNNFDDTTNNIIASANFQGSINLLPDNSSPQPRIPKALKSLYLNNTADQKSYGLIPLSNTEYSVVSISMWLKIESLRLSPAGIINKFFNIRILAFTVGSNFKIALTNQESIAILIETELLNYNQWYHLVITYDYINLSHKLYLNSIVNPTTANIALNNNNPNDNIYIGLINPNNLNNVSMYFTEFYLFEKVLTQSDVNLLYTSEGDLNNFYTQCPFYYRNEELINTNEILDSSIITPDLNLRCFGVYSIVNDIPPNLIIPEIPVVEINSKPLTFYHNNQIYNLNSSDLKKIVDGSFSNGNIYEGDFVEIQTQLNNQALTINQLNTEVNTIDFNLTNLNGTVTNQANLITVNTLNFGVLATEQYTNTANIITNTNNITTLQTKLNGITNADLTDVLLYTENLNLGGFSFNNTNNISYIINPTGIYLLGPIYFSENINNVNTITFSYIANLSSDCQTQLNSLFSQVNLLSTSTTADINQINSIVNNNTNLISSNTTDINSLISQVNLNNQKLASVNINEGIFNIHNQGFYISGESSNFICEGICALRKLSEIIVSESGNIINTTKLDYLSSINEDLQPKLNALTNSIINNTNLINANTTNINNNTNSINTNTNLINNNTTDINLLHNAIFETVINGPSTSVINRITQNANNITQNANNIITNNNNLLNKIHQLEDITRDDLNNPIYSKNLKTDIIDNFNNLQNQINEINNSQNININWFGFSVNTFYTATFSSSNIYFRPREVRFYWNSVNPVLNANNQSFNITNYYDVTRYIFFTFVQSNPSSFSNSYDRVIFKSTTDLQILNPDFSVSGKNNGFIACVLYN